MKEKHTLRIVIISIICVAAIPCLMHLSTLLFLDRQYVPGQAWDSFDAYQDYFKPVVAFPDYYPEGFDPRVDVQFDGYASYAPKGITSWVNANNPNPTGFEAYAMTYFGVDPILAPQEKSYESMAYYLSSMRISRPFGASENASQTVESGASDDIQQPLSWAQDGTLKTHWRETGESSNDGKYTINVKIPFDGTLYTFSFVYAVKGIDSKPRLTALQAILREEADAEAQKMYDSLAYLPD
jgi:hypothetical protein